MFRCAYGLELKWGIMHLRWFCWGDNNNNNDNGDDNDDDGSDIAVDNDDNNNDGLVEKQQRIGLWWQW